MSKKLPCPNCKHLIVIDPQTLTAADSIACEACGSSFKLKKKTNQPPMAQPAQPIQSPKVFDAKVVDVASEQADPLSLGTMNFDDLNAMPSGGADPWALPTANSLGNATQQPAAYYAPTAAKLPAQKAAKPKSMAATLTIVVGSIAGVLLLFCGVGGLLVVRGMMNSNADQRNMTLVALAMMNYESMYKRFPAPAAVDATKNPVYSWTVALTPFIDEKSKFQSFDFGRLLPWDAPGNDLLQSDSPVLFRSARGNAKANERNVFLICKPLMNPPDRDKPLFADGRYASINQISDGTSNTILAIQLTGHSRPWAQPGELTTEEAYDLLKKEPGGALVAMVDGSTHWLPTSISLADFKALASDSGGEVVSVK